MRRTRIDRRSFIVGTGAVALAACSSDDESSTSESSTASSDRPASEPSAAPEPTAIAQPIDTTAESPVDDTASETVDTSADAGLRALTAADFDSLSVCAVLPSTTAGPFPNIARLDRSDITEGYPGSSLRLGIRVVDEQCVPVPGVDVEVWHADASGDYSEYDDNGSGKDEGAGSTFLRGFQQSNAEGIVEFQTIYPGWYEGRSVHIHVTVRLDGTDLLTTQLYFDEAFTAGILATGAYAEFGPVDTPWSQDPLVGDPSTDGSGITLSPADTANGPGTLGLVNIGVPVG